MAVGVYEQNFSFTIRFNTNKRIDNSFKTCNFALIWKTPFLVGFKGS
jgi:hypothetical protein